MKDWPRAGLFLLEGDSVDYPECPKFTAKEQRYIDYISNESNSRVIGDMCKALHTTVRTLFGRTIPGAEKKITAYEQAVRECFRELGIEPELGE